MYWKHSSQIWYHLLNSVPILHNPQTGVFPISKFLIKFLIKKNRRNSRTSNEVMIFSENFDQYKLYKGNATTSKSFDDDIVVFFFNFLALWSNLECTNSGCTVYNFYILLNSNLLSYKIFASLFFPFKGVF